MSVQAKEDCSLCVRESKIGTSRKKEEEKEEKRRQVQMPDTHKVPLHCNRQGGMVNYFECRRGTWVVLRQADFEPQAVQRSIDVDGTASR